MKRSNCINLHNLSQAELAKHEENLLRGGDTVLPCLCVVACGCRYEGEQEGPDDSYYGGSSKAVCNEVNEPITHISGNM